MIHLVYTDAAKRKVARGAYYSAMQYSVLTVLRCCVDEPVMAAAFPKDRKTGLE
jgi:hypothetical protein